MITEIVLFRYDGCTVSWKGMAANVKPGARAKSADAGAIAFDFLVGYQDKKKLEGIVPASIVGADVPVDRALEILATLRAASGSLSMDCAAIHELIQATSP